MPNTEELRHRFLNKLWELFRLDEPDLDFGFYRIMHTKAKEVKDFLEKDLLSVISEEIGEFKDSDIETVERELSLAIQMAKKYGAPNPEEAPAVEQLKVKLEHVIANSNIEAEVYDHLYRFFERYYDGGDFLSRRYYTRETPGRASPFVIPYNGEEVKLHWANADQYYIKSTDHFSNFTFDLMQATDLRKRNAGLSQIDDEHSTMRVHFCVVEASEGEHGDIKVADNKARHFVLSRENPVEFTEQGELRVNFEYRPYTEKGVTKDKLQAKLNDESVQTIFDKLHLYYTTTPPPIAHQNI